MICGVAVCVLLIGGMISAAEIPNANTNSSRRSVSDFVTPDERTDLDVVRKTIPNVAANDSDDIYWDNSISSSISGVDGPVYAMTVHDGKLIVGGEFMVAGGSVVNCIAAWDGTAWSPLGLGTNGPVRALTVYDNKLIAAGRFTIAGGDSAGFIASWDGDHWSALGEGIESLPVYLPVYALEVFQDRLIAAGRFFTAGGVSAMHIAAWDGTSWTALGEGLDGTVFALTVFDNKLIVGGDFRTAGGGPARNVAAFDGVTWGAFASVTQINPVRALAVYDGKLVAGGVNNLTYWTGSDWESLGGGLPPIGYPNYWYSQVNSLAVVDGKLIAAGRFAVGESQPIIDIASFDGNSWSAVGNGMKPDQNEDWRGVSALTVYAGTIVAGGDFTSAGKEPSRFLSSWNGEDWSPLGQQTIGGIHTMTVFGDRLIVGGEFTSAGGLQANHVVAWDAENWWPLGAGIDGPVYALTVFNDALIVAGRFSLAGTDGANCLARWNGTTWSPLGSGVEGDSGAVAQVNALAVHNGNLVIGGSFSTAGGNNARNVASWNGSEWSSIGSGVDQTVRALAVFNTRLVAAQDQSFSRGGLVSEWDGTQWSQLGQCSENAYDGSSLCGEVHALITYDNKLFAGSTHLPSGLCDVLPCPNYAYLEALDGERWELVAYGRGAFNAVNDYDGSLVVGGQGYYYDGGANSIGIFPPDGYAYGLRGLGSGIGLQPFGMSGVEYTEWLGNVRAITTFRDQLVVGGDFSTAGNKVAGSIAIWTKHEPTDVEDDQTTTLPDAFSLVQNYPNPFNPTTTIDYSVSTRTHVTIEILNLLGQHVKTLVDEEKSAGTYRTEWDGKDADGKAVSTGVYLYRLKAGGFEETKKMMLLK